MPQVPLALAVASRGLGLQLEVRREEVVVGCLEPSSSDLHRRPWAPEFVSTAAEEAPEEAEEAAVEAVEAAAEEVAGRRQTRREATECCQPWAPGGGAVNSLGGNRS